MAHTALREIVERAVEEARKLPGLGSSVETESAREGRDIVDHSYEDLLATAILNKVAITNRPEYPRRVRPFAEFEISRGDRASLGINR